jgi:hypothetical protein
LWEIFSEKVGEVVLVYLDCMDGRNWGQRQVSVEDPKKINLFHIRFLQARETAI